MAIGTGGAALGGGIISGLAGSRASSKAAKAQEKAAERQLEFEKQVYADTRALFNPFYQTGLDYQNALRYELLGGDVPIFGADSANVESYTSREKIGERYFTNDGPDKAQDVFGDVTKYRVNGKEFGQDLAAAQAYADANQSGGYEYQGFQATPGYNFLLDQGQAAIDGSAAARGNVFSGATLKAQQEFGTGLANQTYDTFLNRLSAGAASGQAAAGGMATAGSNFASGTGNALANMGNAQAAGYIGQANALSGAIDTGLSAWGYMNDNKHANPASLAPRNSLRPVARPF